MNYYPHHIGDFRSGSINMSRQSRWIYRDLLDIYYDTEKPLPLDLDVLCDMLGVESEEETRIVERLLRFKFVKTEDGYRNSRCDQEIKTYHSKAETAKANGKRGGRPRKADSNPEKPIGFQSGSDKDSAGNQDGTESQTNQEPRTSNQSLKEKEKETASPPAPPADKPKTNGSRLPEGFQVPDDWLDWAANERKDIPISELPSIAAGFTDYWTAKAGAAARKVDWQATWRNWIRNQKRSIAPPVDRPQKFDPLGHINQNRVYDHDIIDI